MSYVKVTQGRDVRVGDTINGRQVLSFEVMREHPTLGPCRAAVFWAETRSGRVRATVFDNFCVSVDCAT